MRRTTLQATVQIIIALGLGLLAGCADSAGPLGRHRLQVEVQTASQPAAAPTPAAPTAASAVGSVEIERAFVVLGGLKLEGASGSGTVDWILEESVVIPLELRAQPTLAFDVDVAPGTYKELEVSIDKLEAGHPEEQALIDASPGLLDASVLVSGTVHRNGSSEPFAFATALDIDLELSFTQPLSVAEGDTRVTLVSVGIDFARWFDAAGGGTLDPLDPAHRSEIEGAIEGSIEVWQRF